MSPSNASLLADTVRNNYNRLYISRPPYIGSYYSLMFVTKDGVHHVWNTYPSMIYALTDMNQVFIHISKRQDNFDF